MNKQGNYSSLTPEQKEKSLENFKSPQVFYRMGDKVQAIKVPELAEKKEKPQQQEQQQKKTEPER